MKEVDTNELRKASVAVYLECPKIVARDISKKLINAADEIDKLRSEAIVQDQT